MGTWYDITRDPDYQTLSDGAKSNLKQEFFNRTIAKDPEFGALSEDAKKATFLNFFQLPDDTGQGQISSMVGSAARGFSEVVPGAIQGLGALTGISPLETAGESIRSGIESVAPVNPLYADSIPVKAAGVVGQIGSVLGTGGLGGLAGKALGAERIAAGATAAEQALATTNAVTRGANAALYGSAGLQGAASGAQLADQYGLEGGARYANILAGSLGEMGTELLPFGTIAETGAVKKLLTGAPVTGRAIGAPISEAFEEGTNQLWQNAALKTLAPEGVNTPGLTEGVLESAAYGGLGGGIIAGVNVATGAYKSPATVAAQGLNDAAKVTSNDTTQTTAMTDATIAQADKADKDKAFEDLAENLRRTQEEGDAADIQAAQMRAQEEYAQDQAAADRQAQFEGLSQNEPAITTPVGGVIPAVGQEEAAAIQPEQQLPDGLGVFEDAQLAANEPTSPESLVGESEGVLRNRAQIANAAALNNGQIAPTPIPSVFPSVQPTVAEQPISPQGEAPTGIATQTGQPMSGERGSVVETEKEAIDSFVKGMAPMAAKRARNALDESVSSGGMPFQRKELIQNKVAAGATVEQKVTTDTARIKKLESLIRSMRNSVPFGNTSHPETIAFNAAKDELDAGPKITQRRLVNPDGSFLAESQISKTAMDYAEYLIARRQSEPNSPAAQKEPPLTPSGQVANEGGGPVTSNETEAGFQVQPPVATKETPDAEVSSADIESKALEILLTERPKLSERITNKAKAYFQSRDENDLKDLSSGFKGSIKKALQDADPNELHAVLVSDREQVEKLKQQAAEDRKADEARAKLQAKLTESRRGAYDSIVGTPTGVEMNAVSEADGQESLALVNNSGDVPGVLNAFVGTSSQFLANPENETNFPDLWKILSAGRVDEGNFAYGRAFVFTDGIGVNASDRRNAERLGVTPSVAAVRRVLIHEGLVHRGIYGLPAGLQMQILQWVRQNTTPEQLDNLARDYPQYENWRNSPNQMLGLCEEYLAKEVEKITKFPKDGPLAKLFNILKDIWRWITGETGEPTVQNLRDVVKLLKAGAEAADAKLVNDGKIAIKESRPSFANPINAELARAAERFRQMNERQAVETPEGLKELFNPNAQGSGTTNKLFEQQVTPQRIRSEIRAAYDRAILGSGSVQTSIQQVFDEVKTQIPTLAEKQFGEQLQALYEDGSAFLVPADRSDTMMAAGERWGVYDASGMPASYVGVMPLEIRASRITNDPRSELPNDIKQQAKVITKLGGQALNSHRALKALRESQPKFHTKQESEPIVGVAVNIVEALEENGVAPEELTEYLIDSDFLDELGIKMNDSLYQALAMEVYRTQLEKADALQEAGDNATANKLRQHVIATQNQWFKSGTEAGQQLRMRQSLMLNPRYQGLFLLSHLNEMIRENAEKTATAQTEIKADDVAEKATQAAEEAAKVTADEFADITMDELDRLGEEQLDAGEKSSWAKIKGYIARLGASAIARLRKSGEIKASNAAESAGDLVKKFLAMSDAEHDADDAATHKALKAELASFLGKGTEAKKKVKKALVEGAEEKVKKPRAKKPKATAEEKAKRKEERANGVAQRLIYRTQELFRQGFKNEAKKSNADSILKVFRDQVNQPMSDAAFTERLKKLNVTADVAQRMLNTAERERADHLRMEKNALLDSEEALKKIIKKLTDKLGVFQISPQSWKDLFSTSTASQEQRKEEMEAAIKADPIFQNLDADDQKLLADLLEEAWEAKRKDVFEAEIKRLTRIKKTSAEAAKALTGKDSTEKLLQLVNQGLLNNDEFYKAVAAKFGFKDLTQEQKDRLKEIAQELQKDDLPPHKRTMLAEEFKNTVEEVAQVPFAQIAADTWVTSVLTGWRTAVTIALAAESGGYQVISTALAEILKNTSDLNAWKTAGSAINAWISSMPRNARNALGYLWDGKADRIDPTMSNLAAYLDLDKKELSRVNTANSLLKSKNVFSRLLGHYLHFFQKFLTALDLFNAASAKEGSAPIAYYQTRSNREGPFDIKEFAKLRDFKAARKHILNTEFEGVEPTSALERSRVDAWATQYMWQQISKLEGVLENANYNAQQGAMTLDPGGVGGMLYHAILSLQASQKKKAEDFLQEAKIAALQAETTQEKLVAKNKMALAYLYQFAAYNMLGAVGLKFARYAGNRLNQTISFVPFLGLARLNEKKGVPQEMHSAQIIANQAVGFAVALGAYALLKAIADEPDEEKRGFGLSGSWDSLTPERKSQLMSSGKQPYTITIGGKVYKYNNWPMGGIIAAVGSLADLAQYQPEKWNEKTLPGKLASGTLAALLSVGDSASLSQFSEMFGRSVQTRDPLDAAAHTLSKTAAGWAGGFIPRLLKDVDAYFSPEINRYKTPFEFMAREVPVYRRGVGKPLLDIFAEPVAPSRGPLSREFIEQPTEPEYRAIGRLNEHGVFLTPADPQNRLVGKGHNKRHMTDEEGLRYMQLTGKGYKEFVLRYSPKILSMPRDRAKQFVLDKADEIRDKAAKQSIKR